eukprot:TRINITY_DN3980_c0_g1_i1.p1 TRINITY_DN3980_c0_g1~~TRINITY_DN3980_c0_g1_i1.p1  ORF type:complete len:286 (-),score=123.28 TRINITY_DN3980_c0_g1_i1:49-906(-)
MPIGKFGDIGKAAKDTINKKYVSNATLEVNSKNPSSKVNTTVKRAADGSLSGEFEVKTDLCSNSNATFVFTPQGDIKFETEIKGLVKGLKLNVDAALAAKEGKASFKGAKFNALYTHDLFSLNASISKPTSPVLALSPVVGGKYNDVSVRVGADMAFNVMNQKMTKGDYGVGVSYKAFEAAVLCKDSGKSQELSFYHKYDAATAFAANASGKLFGEKPLLFNVGIAHACNKFTTMKAKMASSGVASISVVQKLTPKVSLTLCGSADTTNMKEDVHKAGMSLTVEL